MSFHHSKSFFAILFTSVSALQAPPGKGAPRIVNENVTEAVARSFTAFKEKHGRAYEQGSREHEMRLELFRRRAAEIERLNNLPSRTWTAGINMLTDRTDAELSALKGWKPSSRKRNSDADEAFTDFENVDLPESFDWLHLSNMDFIRDQGMCGSCWAVTSTTVLAAHSEIHAGNRSFSTQQVVDCVPNPNDCGGTGGCDGATVELAFQYVMMVGSKEPDKYPYIAKDGTCDWTPTDSSTPSMQTLTEIGAHAKVFRASEDAPGLAFGMKAWQKLPSNTMRPLMYAVHTFGPVAVALAANDIMMYERGIFNGCRDWVVNHAVTLIGYGVDDGKKYWLVQNSWGEYWGEVGRIRIQRSDDDDSNCGMDHSPQDGIACKGETEPVEVCGTCGILYDSIVPRFDKNI